jgi:cytochrome P450
VFPFQGTLLALNFYSIHMDKSYWGDPENFRPERFLDENQKFVKSDRIFAFGSGK